SRRRGQGEDREVFSPGPRSIPRPKARPRLPRNPQPPVQPLGRSRLQRPAARRPRHETDRPLRHRPRPGPLPGAGRAHRRTLLRRGHKEGQKGQHLLLRRPPLRNPRRPARPGDPAPLRPPSHRHRRRRHLPQGPAPRRRPTPRRRRQRPPPPKGTAMIIRSFYGLTQNPFDRRELELLPQQREIHETLKVHCQQGGLCLVLGRPGTGKSVIKKSLQALPESQYLVATVARTLHTYTNTVKI